MEGQGQAQSRRLRREGERASWARTCDTLGQRASSSSCGLAGVGGRTWTLGGHRRRIQRTVIESWSLDRGLGFEVQSGRWGDRLGKMGPWSGACPLGPSQPSLALPLAVTGSAVERTMLGAWRVKQHLPWALAGQCGQLTGATLEIGVTSQPWFASDLPPGKSIIPRWAGHGVAWCRPIFLLAQGQRH